MNKLNNYVVQLLNKEFYLKINNKCKPKNNILFNILDIIVLIANTIIACSNAWNTDFKNITASDVDSSKIIFLLTMIIVFRNYIALHKKRHNQKDLCLKKDGFSCEKESGFYYEVPFYKNAIKAHAYLFIFVLISFCLTIKYQTDALVISVKIFSTLNYIMALCSGILSDISDLYNVKPITLTIPKG